MPSEYASHWTLDPTIVFLNHGSFGACPAAIQKEQQVFRDALEAEPLRFFLREYDDLLDASRRRLAAFVGADSSDLVFVPNATAAVNAVLRSLRFEPGDELLVTDHAYNACRNAADYVTQRAGARLVIATLPVPVDGPDRVVSAVLDQVTDRTRLVMIDHVTSATALILPVREIVARLAERGIDTLIDGAHAPGMLPLDMEAIGAAYYTGNCHKWLCAPKGAAFLHVRRDRQDRIQPLTISHGYNTPNRGKSVFQRSFDWPGTVDPSAWLCVGKAIEWGGGLMPGGWDALRRRNHALTLQARDRLGAAWGTAPICPDAMVGSMAVIPTPPIDPAILPPQKSGGVDPLQELFFDRFGMEATAIAWPPGSDRRYVRVSVQAYNALDDYQHLIDAMAELIG